MEDKNIHSKIINQVCKEVLSPLGVFRKGLSRIYLDDNGYFFTVVEFQPSNWNTGTYLNIGLTFLWDNNQSDALYFSFSRQPAARYGKFVEYKNETQFRNEITELVKIAKDEILFYRRLRNIEFAKDYMIKYANKFGDNKYAQFGPYLANICILNGDYESAKFYSDNYCKERNMTKKPEDTSKEKLLSNIKKSRQTWHDKSSMKKMPVNNTYDVDDDDTAEIVSSMTITGIL